MLFRMDVYFYEAFAEEAAGLRGALPGGIAAGFTDATVQESGHAAPPSKLISTRTQSRVPTAWAAQLDGWLTRSTGYDHVLAWWRAADARTALGYLPLYCHRACAEQAILLMLALLRKVPRQVSQFERFARDGLTGREAAGRTMAVVGVGNIGGEVYRLGAALGMAVIGVDIDPRHDDVRYTSIDEAMRRAEVIVCAMNLTAANRGYFDAARWATARDGAVFVNVSRGELSPSGALLAAVKTGKLGGVALDVYDDEATLAVALRHAGAATSAEAQAALELARCENVICTPHNAFNTAEAVERKVEHAVRQVEAFLRAGRFVWPVPGR